MSLSLYLIFLFVSFGASVAGAVCGIGGGVLIKPILDAFEVLSVPAISFLSGSTVLSMCCYSVVKGWMSKESLVDKKTGTPLALGAALGGIVGKEIFRAVANQFPHQDKVGAVQAFCLLLITIGTLVYTIKKDKIRTYQVKNSLLSAVIGSVLGICSSFLGIGGGPINLVVLYFFFSMETKTAAQNSLYIILFSQITSILNTVLTGSIPEFSWKLLVLMAGGGILGGVFGRMINKKISSPAVNKLFIVLMVGIILINIYNIYIFI